MKILDEVLFPNDLMCYSSGFCGQKLQLIKFKSNSEVYTSINDFGLRLNWHGELIIDEFHGIMNFTVF